MFERIKELLIENKDSFTNGVTETAGEVYIHGSQDNLQKFAELIIIECASIAYKSCDQGDMAAQSILYEFNIDNAQQQK